jgi:hypothetical protein
MSDLLPVEPLFQKIRQLIDSAKLSYFYGAFSNLIAPEIET